MKKTRYNYSVVKLGDKGVKTQIINGTEYVFIDKPYWDKAKKQNRHVRDYVGKIGEDGEFIPSKKYLARLKKESGDEQELKELIASKKFFGATHLLDNIGNITGVERDLKESFGKEFGKKIMSLAYFLILEGESSMYRFKKFAKTHHHPCGEVLSSQRISDIFADISENEKMLFFKKRTKRCLENEYLAYDITSISSYSEIMDQVKYGRNKDLENLPQINLAMIFGEESMLPTYYRKMPGNINDVSTIKKLLIDIDFLGLKKIKFVLDRGFYSADNINSLYRNRYHFIVAGRANTTLYRETIEQYREDIKNFTNYSIENDIYCISKKDIWKYEYLNKKSEKMFSNKKIYIHVYYDGIRAEGEKRDFIKKLKSAEDAYNSGYCSDSQKELCSKYFVVSGRSSAVSLVVDQTAVNEHMKKFGYFMLLSNHITDPHMAISIYRRKDVVEKTFFNIKNRLDMKRSKVSTEESLEGKLFVQFVALIYISYIHQIMLKHNLYKNYSMASLLDELDIIESFEYQGKKRHTSEITTKQEDIFRYFDVTI